MVDEKRKLSLIQTLQQGPLQESLAPSTLRRSEFLPFIRKMEKLLIDQAAGDTVVIYWSSTDAAWLMPKRAGLTLLTQASSAITSLSEHRSDQGDEFCFLVVSKELSLGLYGASSEALGSDPVYLCTGTFDPKLISRLAQVMLPYWEFIDPMETDKLDEMLRKVGFKPTAMHFANSLGIEWSGLKAGGEIMGAGAPEASVMRTLERTVEGTNTSVSADMSKAARAALNGGNAEPKQSAAQAQKTDIFSVSDHDFGMRIANYYPYPIASPFRTLESITNASEKYKEQLKLIENLLALLAGISLAVSAQNEPAVLADLRECVAAGVSMGHWRVLIRKCTVGWKGSSTKDIPIAKAITGLRMELTEKGFGKCVEQLIRTRNDFAHHRGPTAESEIEKETVRLDSLLKDCIKYTDFLCEHPIKIVKAIDVLPSGMIKMICLKAIGDHPALRQEELCLSRGFPKGHLILNAGDSNWLSLYPFLSQDICTTCGTMEIYHLDKWKYEKNKVQVRSFERGHPLESSAISDWLKKLESTAKV